MTMIRVWHCYFYGSAETTIMLAESEEALRQRIDAVVAEEWDEDWGPMPEDHDALVETFTESQDVMYFGDYGWTDVDASACDVVTP